MKNKKLLMVALVFVFSSMSFVAWVNADDSNEFNKDKDLGAKIVEAIDTRPKTSAAAMLIALAGDPILGSLLFGHAYYTAHKGTKNLNFHLVMALGAVAALSELYYWYFPRKKKLVEQPVQPVEEGQGTVKLELQLHG